MNVEIERKLNAKYFETNLGKMIGVSNGHFLVLLEFENRKNIKKHIQKIEEKHKAVIHFEDDAILLKLEDELLEYLEGTRKKFSVPLKFKGTKFQEKVWEELAKIPYGQTISYGDLAVKIGNEKAYRAVALANSLNNLAIIIPCHRVINKSGKLGGYAGGLEKKVKLLDLEIGGHPIWGHPP